jgi:hypothetical protein
MTHNSCQNKGLSQKAHSPLGCDFSIDALLDRIKQVERQDDMHVLRNLDRQYHMLERNVLREREKWQRVMKLLGRLHYIKDLLERAMASYINSIASAQRRFQGDEDLGLLLTN